jgi:hypothetical protein
MGNFDFTSLARHEFPKCLPKMVSTRDICFISNCMQFTSDVSPTLKPSQIVFDKDGERLRAVIPAEVYSYFHASTQRPLSFIPRHTG